MHLPVPTSNRREQDKLHSLPVTVGATSYEGHSGPGLGGGLWCCSRRRLRGRYRGSETLTRLEREVGTPRLTSPRACGGVRGITLPLHTHILLGYTSVPTDPIS